MWFDAKKLKLPTAADALPGRETAAQLERLFNKEVAKAKPVTLQAWGNRPVDERFREFYSRALETLL